MQAIVSTMSAHYGKTIELQRVYYSNSVLVVDAVAKADDVEMSEPYYYLSGFHATTPRIESLAFSCITAGLASSFYTKKGSGVTSVDALFDKVSQGPNRAVGFIGQGNYDAVSAMLPDSTTATFVTNSSDMAANVLSGALVAGYVSEGAPLNAELFDVFETGIVSPRVSLFHKDVLTCTDDADDVSIVAIIVVAAITLVLALLLSFVIVRERVGKPLFMPLLHQAAVEGVKPQL